MNDYKPTFAEPCIYLAAQTYEIESPAIYYVFCMWPWPTLIPYPCICSETFLTLIFTSWIHTQIWIL